jgi:ABC-type multidrug transport system ATPase subunit
MGITVVVIIHQPRKEVFNCLDGIFLLRKGRKVYQGSRAEAQSYFESLGYNFSRTSNPADSLIDTMAIDHHHDAAEEVLKGINEVSTVFFEQDERSDLLSLLMSHRASWSKQIWLCLLRSLRQQQRRISSLFLEILVGVG